MGDYETNRRKSCGLALLGLAWCSVWIYFFSEQVAYINYNYVAPAGKGYNSNAVPNCYYDYNTNIYTTGPPLFPGNDTIDNYSDRFAILIKTGLALFVIKAFGFLIHLCKPHKKAGGAKAGIISLAFLGWFITANVFIFNVEGRSCAAEYINDTVFNASHTY